MPNLSSLIKSIRDIMREARGLSGDGQRIEQLAWMLFLKIMDDKCQTTRISLNLPKICIHENVNRYIH